MNRCFLFFGVRTENVETPEQRVAAVEHQELQKQQDESRSDQVLELFVELLEAEGRQVAFLHIVDRTYDFVQPDRLVGRADVGSVGRLCDLFEQGFAQFRYDHLSLVVLDELAADLDRSAFRRADADGEDADALFGGPFGRFDGAGVVPFAVGDEHDDASCGVISLFRKGHGGQREGLTDVGALHRNHRR